MKPCKRNAAIKQTHNSVNGNRNHTQKSNKLMKGHRSWPFIYDS